jgi:hypothetical protein
MAPIKSLVVSAMLALAAIASPIDVETRQVDKLTCANVRCSIGYICVMLGPNDPRCIPEGEKCGGILCPTGTVCCNPLRNICVKPGMFCIM